MIFFKPERDTIFTPRQISLNEAITFPNLLDYIPFLEPESI